MKQIDTENLSDKEIEKLLQEPLDIDDKYVLERERLSRKKHFTIFLLLLAWIFAMFAFSGCSVKEDLATSQQKTELLEKKVSEKNKTIARLQELLDECEAERR